MLHLREIHIAVEQVVRCDTRSYNITIASACLYIRLHLSYLFQSYRIKKVTVPLRYHIVPELRVNTMADTRLLSACTGLELVLYVSHVSPTTAVNKSDLWKLEEAAKDEALTLE